MTAVRDWVGSGLEADPADADVLGVWLYRSRRLCVMGWGAKTHIRTSWELRVSAVGDWVRSGGEGKTSD